jgi:STE24 endopeptidase
VTPLFTREQIERATRYHRPLYLVALVTIALDLAVLALLTFGPLGAELYGVTSGLPWWGRTITFSALVLALTTLFGLPLRYWAGYRHEHEWGFSTETRQAWAVDRLKGFAVGLVVGCCWLAGLIAAAHAWPHLWPLPVGLAAAGLVLVLGFLAPLVLEPLFNRFRPLDDAALAASLLALADRAGVPITHVLVADASKRTRKVNAYVSGLGRSRRVVVFDTLLQDATSPELHLVVAHELGHRRRRHVAKNTALGMLGAAGFVFVIWALLESSGLRSAIGVTDAGDPRVIPFVLFVASVLGALASPFGSALSRRWERQADAFSLQLTHDTEAFIGTHHRLALANLADLEPPRLAYLAWFGHPTPPERIASAG